MTMTDRLKVLIACAMSPYTGYGNDGLGLAQAFIDSGADVYVRPPHVAPPLPPSVAELFTKGLEAPFDILIDHQDPGLFGGDANLARASKVSVAATMWEMSNLSNQPARHTINKRMSQFDIFLPYDRNTRDVFKPYMPEKTYVEVLQGGYDPRDWGYLERDWDSDRFSFCMLGQLSNRKNPWAVLDAWARLWADHADEMRNVELHLKTSNCALPVGLDQFYQNLRVHSQSWPTSVVRDFYGSNHCLLAPSRGEGKNLPALEFLTTGGAVIATNWGGHTEWLTERWAYPLNDYALVPIEDKFPDCHWAAVDPQSLAYTMLHVLRNRHEARDRALVASREVPKLKSWDAYVQGVYNVIKRSGVRGAAEVSAKIDAL